MLTVQDLKPYQRKVANAIVSKPDLFVFLTMGLGKTVSTLMAIQYLIKKKRYKPALVVAPLRVVYSSWPAELKKWKELSTLKYHIIHGKGKTTALPRVDIYLTNYETIPYIVDKKLYRKMDIFVADESSFLKSHKAKTRFKKLKNITQSFKKKIFLTGTPSPSGELWELWAQTYLMDQGKRLKKSFWQFRGTYYDKDFMGYNYTLKPGAKQVIEDRIKDIQITMTAEDYMSLPGRIEKEITIRIPEGIKKKYYNQMEKEFIVQVKEGVVTAANAAVMSSKLRQITAGGMYIDGKEYINIHQEKTDCLKQIVETNSSNILCGYQFKFEKSFIKRSMPYAEFLDGSTSAKKSTQIIDRWNKGSIKLLCCHPASAGYGLNLQSGGNILVWLSRDWSLEKTVQFEARLLRQGQKKTVFIYDIVADKTIDTVIKQALSRKHKGQQSLIAALKDYYC